MSDIIINGNTYNNRDFLVVQTTDGGTTKFTEGERPFGTINITENGSHDVTNYKTANVNVLSSEPVLQEKTVTENGEVTADEGYDGLSKVTVNVATGSSDLVDVDALPTENLENNKIYRVTNVDGEHYVGFDDGESGFTVMSVNELLNAMIGGMGYSINFTDTLVDSIDDVADPLISGMDIGQGVANYYVYTDTSSYIGYLWTDSSTRTTLADMLAENLGIPLEHKGIVDNSSDIASDGVYFVDTSTVEIGVPNAENDKQILQYNGTEWVESGGSAPYTLRLGG